jgi:ribonuclease HII
MLIAGIDEAGRGPVIGPMVMAIAALEEKDLPELERLGITDSKLLSPERREGLLSAVKRLCETAVEVISPQAVDEAVNDPSRNLNTLEAEVAGRLIDTLAERVGPYKIKHVILDCPSVNPEGYLVVLRKFVRRDVQIITEHKADLHHRIVGAASIVAKVLRDAEIESLKQKHGVDFGSGYPSDAKTARFVRLHYKDYDFFRTSWAPYKEASAAGSQQGLARFGAETVLPPETVAKKEMLLRLEEDGFGQIPAVGTSEAVRMQRPGCTITLYHNGKVLVQGREKSKWEKAVKDLLG